MKILFLSTWFPFSPDNGSKIRAYYLLKELNRRHNVTVVTFDPQNEWPEAKKHKIWENNHNLEVFPVPVDPYRYVHLPNIIKYISPISLACWPSTEMRRTVDRVKRNNNYDAVVALGEPVASYAAQFPTAWRLLDVDSSFGYKRFQAMNEVGSRLRRGMTWASWQKLRLYEKRIFAMYDVCTMVMQEEVDFFIEAFPLDNTEFLLNENGVDVNHHQPNKDEKTPNSLIYNGSLTYSANFDAMRYFLKKIYPRIKAEIPETTLTITGSITGVDLKKLALDESVHLTGFVDDIRPYVRRSAVCVVPIRQGGGTRIKILESMALGTPVVATGKGAEGLAVSPGKQLLMADDPEKFASSTVQLLRNPKLGQHLARCGRDLVEERYNWQMIAAQFADLLE